MGRWRGYPIPSRGVLGSLSETDFADAAFVSSRVNIYRAVGFEFRRSWYSQALAPSSWLHYVINKFIFENILLAKRIPTADREIALLLYGYGAELGNFKFFADDLATELVK